LGVVKTARNLTTPGQPANIENGVGDTLEFTITVTNTGNQTMSNIMVSDPMLTGLSCTVNGLAPTNLVIAPSEAAICIGTYVVTQDDIDNEIVTNKASAEGANPQGEITQNDGTVDYPVEAPAPELTVTKTLIPNGGMTDYIAVGETLRFRISVLNSGNITFNDIAVTDSEVAGTCDVGTLAPDETDDSCIFEYTILQSDIDNGTFENTATATGTPAIDGGTPADFDDTLVSDGPAREPAIGVGKVGTGPLAGGTFDTLGDRIDYVFTIANLGNVTLNEAPTLVDDKIGAITDCDPIPTPNGLLPTETLECRGFYIVDQDDVDAGFVTNVVDATMDNEYDPGQVLEAQATETVDAERSSGMEITKEASVDTDLQVDTEITYTYTVKNTGNVRLNNIVLTDEHTSASGVSNLTILVDDTILVIEPGSSATRTAIYVVTQEDVDAGVPLTNTLTAVAQTPPGLDPITETADESVSIDPKDAEMTVLKTIPSPPAALIVGANVTFQITVENTGNVTLGLPDLSDTLSTVNDLGKADETLNPVFQSGNDDDPLEFNVDEIFVYEVTYALTQEDLDAGGISNTVTATATDPQGDTVTDVSDDGNGGDDDPTVLPVSPAGLLDVIKTVRTAAPDPAAPLDEVVFQITVENTGNVTLTAPIIADTLSRADGVEITPAPTAVFEPGGDTDGDSALDVGETWIYTVTHPLTQDDIDAGGLSNTATATANDPAGNTVEDVSNNGAGGGDDPTTTPINANPSLEVLKPVTSTLPAVPKPNDIVTFEIEVENTGNVTLTAPVLTDTISPVGGVAITPNPVPVLVPSSDTNGDGDLDVDETWIYTLDYPLTQADIDAGGVENSVVATADDPSGTEVEDTSNNTDTPGDTPTTATLNQVPGLETIKSVINAPTVANDLVQFEITVLNTGNVTLSNVDIASDTLTRADGTPLTLISLPGFIAADDGSAEGTLKAGETATYRAAYILLQEDIDAGGISNTATAQGTPPGDGGPTYDGTDDVLTFAFDVTNTGNVTIESPVTIDDPLLTSLGGTVACPPVDLLPDDMITCEGSFTVVQGQIDAGSLTNTATAVSNLATSDPSSVTVLAQQNPAVGAIIAYEYTVENTGNTTITEAITVTDNLIAPVTCPPLPAGGLAPTQSIVCEATFEVTADDVSIGSVTNLASASDGTTTSDIVSETVPAGGVPALTTTKALISADCR